MRERTAALSAANEDLRRAMKRIAQSEKLASLGSLVAGVAHELNTPLGNARTVASTMHDHVRDLRAGMQHGGLRRSVLEGFLDASDEAAGMLERNLARAAELIGNFKQVAVDQTSMRRRRFDLRQVCEECCRHCSRNCDGIRIVSRSRCRPASCLTATPDPSSRC